MKENQHNMLQDNPKSSGPSLVDEIRGIIEKGQKQACSSVNQAVIVTYWSIGRRIVEEEQYGNTRADYGKQLINQLADKLSVEYGNNYTARRLRDYRQFYLRFKDLQIWHSRVPNLTWTHFRRIMAVPQEEARQWYANEASREMWSVRTLDRNIST